jgi:hypothetical protein
VFDYFLYFEVDFLLFDFQLLLFLSDFLDAFDFFCLFSAILDVDHRAASLVLEMELFFGCLILNHLL